MSVFTLITINLNQLELHDVWYVVFYVWFSLTLVLAFIIV